MASDPVDTFIYVYNHLNKNTLSLLDSLYANELHFHDPIREIYGLAAYRAYLAHLYDKVTECRFDIVQIDRGDHWAWISWNMLCVHPTLNKGRPIQLEGCSRLTFREKVLEQHDYYDLGAMVYENLPLIGSLIKQLKKRAGA